MPHEEERREGEAAGGAPFFARDSPVSGQRELQNFSKKSLRFILTKKYGHGKMSTERREWVVFRFPASHGEQQGNSISRDGGVEFIQSLFIFFGACAGKCAANSEIFIEATER